MDTLLVQSNEVNSPNSLISQSSRLIDLPNPKVYSGLAGDFVRIIEPHSEADPIAILVQFLACFGNIVGLGPNFKVEGTIHFLKINPVIVGTTSKGRKGTSWGRVRNIFESIDSTWAKVSIVTGLSSGEGLIHAVNTMEKGPSGNRLLVIESEFSSVLKVMRREGNILSAILRSAWDGSHLQNLTKQNPLRAQDAHITIIGHITVEELTRYLTETEMASGFGNRILWVFTQRSKLLPDGGRISTENFTPLYKRLIKSIEFAKSAGEITRNVESNVLWHKHYEKLSEGQPGLVGALLGRAEAYVMRLSCLYALLDGTNNILPIHLQAALSLWEYCENSVSLIFESGSGDPVLDRILSALKCTPKGLSKTKIYGLFAGHRKKAEIDQALDALINDELIYLKDEFTPGRARQVYFYNAKNAN